MATDAKLSFTIRRPTPVSRASSTGADSDFKVPALPRHLAGSANSSAPGSPLRRESPKPNSRTYKERDSSDEDDGVEDELVTGFDMFGVQRLHEKKQPQGPLVIPALKNKDWRELARKRKNLYVPPSAAATGADGSVGGLGTKDTINSGPQLSGLQSRKRVKVDEDMAEVEMEETAVDAVAEAPQEDESEDQRAIRALIASAEHGDSEQDGPRVDIIPAATEDDAYRQDVVELPDSATLDDYERVPVAQFGAALLRGMGWKDGTAASRKGTGPIEPWLPQARPALLGIGAKEKEVLDDGSKKKKKTFVDKKYMPVIKKELKGDKSDDRESGSGSSSRRRSPSPRSSRRSPSSDHRRRRDRDAVDDRDRDRDRDRKYDNGRDGDRERDRDRHGRDDRRNDRDRDRKRDSDYKDSESDSRRNRERDRSARRDRSVDKDSDRSRRERDRRDY